MDKKKIAREKIVSVHWLTLFMLLLMTTIVTENMKDKKKQNKTHDVKL